LWQNNDFSNELIINIQTNSSVCLEHFLFSDKMFLILWIHNSLFYFLFWYHNTFFFGMLCVCVCVCVCVFEQKPLAIFLFLREQPPQTLGVRVIKLENLFQKKKTYLNYHYNAFNSFWGSCLFKILWSCEFYSNL